MKLSLHHLVIRSYTSTLKVLAPLTAGLWVGMLALGSAESVAAAERLVVAYGGVTEPFSVVDLKTFVETGKLPSNWKLYLRLAKVEQEDARAFLNQQVPVDLLEADRILNSLPGEFVLFQTGKVIHTPQSVENGRAIRAAIIKSVSDGQISLIEFIENYPAQDVFFDMKKMLEVTRKVQTVRAEVKETLQGWLNVVQDFLNCDCVATSSQPPRE